VSIFAHGWTDNEADVSPERIDNHFTRLLSSMPGTHEGPKTGDVIYVDSTGEKQQTWIENQTGIFDATDLVTSVEPIEGGFTVVGRKRSNGITRVGDLWSVDCDDIESSPGHRQGRVRP
jgi:hypothetical protein